MAEPSCSIVIWDAEETKNRLPDNVKKILAEKNIQFYIINATKIA